MFIPTFDQEKSRPQGRLFSFPAGSGPLPVSFVTPKNMQTALSFLLETFPSLLRGIDPATPPRFGKMNLQQMIEHMAEAVRNANGKAVFPEVLTPAERIPAMQEFVVGPKEFRPNTVNQLMPAEPTPARLPGVEAAIADLEAELAAFVRHFEANPGLKVRNPFFGDLNYEQWVALLSKHARHHLRQFGWEQAA